MTVETRQSQEATNGSDRLWHWPILNGLNFRGHRCDSHDRYYMAQILHLSLRERIFRMFEIELAFYESLKHGFQVGQVAFKSTTVY